MAVSSTGSSSLDSIATAYQSTEQEKAAQEDALGMDAFLTMLVAQLQNQDPLNPQDGSEFSAQLAQFSQLEQLINLNDSIGGISSSLTQTSDRDYLNYIGKQVTGNVDVMNVDAGSVSGGFYSLSQPGDVIVSVTDANGAVVKTLYEGQQETGAHIISWDGTDNSGEAVADGTYKYTVLANAGSGYIDVPSSVSGKVEGITYDNGKAYLVVQGVLLDPDSLTAVIDNSEIGGSGSVDSVLDYLGRTVSSNFPIVLVEDDAVTGEALTFDLENQEDVTIEIYNAFDELVDTVALSADETASGENRVDWDAVGSSGYTVDDGLYYYTVKINSTSEEARTSVTEEVSGIKYMNGTQYLVLNESGRLLSASNITGIN